MPKKILIADDSYFMRRMLKDILSQTGHEVIEADSGASAFEQYNQEQPDLVFLDIVMPEGEEAGVTVLKNIMNVNAKIPVFMLTSIGQKLVVDECNRLGAKGYIIKPFEAENILNVVQEHL